MRNSNPRHHPCCANRRQFLAGALAGGASMALPLPASAAEFRSLSGTVFVNRRIASMRTAIRPGDSVVASQGASATFVLGADAFRVRGRTALTLDPGDGVVVRGLRILTGALLGVFGRSREQRLVGFRNATIGIRGTALYLDVTPTRTYLCTCYGETNLWAEGEPHITRATHHSAQYVDFGAGGTMTMQATRVIGHDDDELRELEGFTAGSRRSTPERRPSPPPRPGRDSAGPGGGRTCSLTPPDRSRRPP